MKTTAPNGLAIARTATFGDRLPSELALALAVLESFISWFSSAMIKTRSDTELV